MNRLLLVMYLILTACTPQLANPANITPVTAIPTIDASDHSALCQIAQQRSEDWVHTITALEALIEQGEACPNTDITPLDALYSAYLGYGTQLEQQGYREAARIQYETAAQLKPTGMEAQARLIRMDDKRRNQDQEVYVEECDPTSIQTEEDQPVSYTPTDQIWIELNEGRFIRDGLPFPVYGVSYFPRDTPFRRFLSETELDAVEEEFDLIQKSGINTLRIFLYYADLFICPETDATPNAAHIMLLDEIIQMARKYELYLIMTLHHGAEQMHTSLYENPEFIQEQTGFIVERYRDEPTILAWDLRDQGDFDYRQGEYTREEILTWLAETAIAVRVLDARHPITAGWWQDAVATTPLVDFVSFQFYGEYQDLRQEIANLRAVIEKPILLTAIGYSTFAIDEIAQRNLLFQAFEEVKHNKLLGWVVYMAFDYPRMATCIPPDCPGEGNSIDHYGLWNTSYFPKLAVDAVQISTGIQE